MTQQLRVVERAARNGARALVGHDEYECPGCCELAEYRIVADVYGRTAGRHCTQVTPKQRIGFEKQIVARLAALAADTAETP